MFSLIELKGLRCLFVNAAGLAFPSFQTDNKEIKSKFLAKAKDFKYSQHLMFMFTITDRDD